MVYEEVFKYNGLAEACRGLDSAVPIASFTARVCTWARPSSYIRPAGSIPAVDDDSCRRLDHAELEVGDAKCSVYKQGQTNAHHEAEKSSGNTIRSRLCSICTTNIDDLDEAATRRRAAPGLAIRPRLAGEHKLNPLAAGKAETASESWLCREQEPRPSGLRPAKEFNHDAGMVTET